MKRLAIAAALAVAPFLASCAQTDPPQEVVDSSTLALESMIRTPEGHQIINLMHQARAVVICPNIFRGAFIFGGEGGGCVMAARAGGGSWSNPAFYTLGSGSFGLQAGIQNAQVIMFVMTNGGLNALLDSQFKLGADAGLTFATLGTGASGAMSTGLSADIITFSKSQGLYGGISLAGSVLANDSAAEQGYYGTAYAARDVVVNMSGNNPGANPLRAMLTRYGG